MFTIRPYRQNDHDAVYDICLKTGNSGRGAEHLYDDPMLLGHLYAGPYITIEPNTAFILDNGQKPCGYILGAKESKSFYKKMLNDWLIPLREKYKKPTSEENEWSKDEQIIHQIFHPETPRVFPKYPSHLHIDLLPIAQGKGLGNNMMDHFMKYLIKQGSTGVHLGLGIKNKRAFYFYKKYGMTELERDDDTIYMGLKL
ncbi:MAG: GNAT family N-acetyltransferase [Candidatus Marinimicrobia bacterium]|jgi:ribosomal protein S18 acetylase RimI-like enzyme|nr:GNAT family N-acetyltransferase [Candidatus Neomarinimicrobiota bacterium]MBT4734465.1 GNAT family N-acetyltransferase [Candidatus Neomarinimicrobiota bacterium]MBT6470649.1 GNAT family N-acetyltransferase [Candidatus Neomarinimicrobiota bacterium]MBT7900416.1 GNAT family N-acetyltransferase [Candidatus Neomarinimicrobiota bacterium]